MRPTQTAKCDSSVSVSLSDGHRSLETAARAVWARTRGVFFAALRSSATSANLEASKDASQVAKKTGEVNAF